MVTLIDLIFALQLARMHVVSRIYERDMKKSGKANKLPSALNIWVVEIQRLN
jgi:hypothetical protein